ncbi:MAG: hypothetical protein AABY16_00620 [Nanoarchaeota archaeon]
MGIKPRPCVAALESLFEKPYSVSVEVDKIGRFVYRASVSVFAHRRLLVVPLPRKLVGRIFVESKYFHSNGQSSVSDYANVYWRDADFAREYAERVYRTLADNDVKLEGASAPR